MVGEQSALHDQPNAAFTGTQADQPWIELYHSRPSWKVCQISFKKDDDSWIPFGSFVLIDASEIRPGFRVFRVRAKRLEFRLANGSNTVTDSNNGLNYLVEAPGRYVVESGSGCRRVSDAQTADCLRALRPEDRFVELTFEPKDTWRNCFVTYILEGEISTKWHKLPMDANCMRESWRQRIDARTGVTCAFTDGFEKWDSNNNHNYHIRLPGKYTVGAGNVLYHGVSDMDMHQR